MAIDVIETPQKTFVKIVAKGPRGATGDVTPEALAAKDAAEQAATTASEEAGAAATAASTATGAASTASDKAVEAAQSATQAEAARDAAMVGADLYPDEATGRAAVADGEYFKVVSSDPNVASNLYQRVDAAASTFVTAYPSSKSVDTVTTTLNAQLSKAQQEVDGYIPLYGSNDEQPGRMAGFDAANAEFQFLGMPTNRTMAAAIQQIQDYVLAIAGQIQWSSLAPVYVGGQKGGWWAPNEQPSMFQDSSGLIPVTAAGQPIVLLKDLSGNGYDITFTDAVYQIDDLGRPYIEFNGTTTYGAFDPQLFADCPGLTVSMAIQFDSLAASQFPLFVSTSANTSGTRLGVGIYNASPDVEVLGRRENTDTVKRALVDSIQPGSAFVASAMVGYQDDALVTYLNGKEISRVEPFQGAGVAPGQPLIAHIGRFANGGAYWQGRLYGLMFRVPPVSGAEQPMVDGYMQGLLAQKGPGPVPPPAVINVIIMFGQSNKDGRVPIASGPEWIRGGTVPGVSVWNGSGITSFTLSDVGPTGNGSSWVQPESINKFSFGEIAAKQIAETMENVVVCQVTSGGSPMAPVSYARGSWCPDYEEIPEGTPHLLEALIDRIQGLQDYCAANNVTLNIRAAIWHQGESDSRYTGADTAYLGRLTDLVAAIRTQVGDPNLPFIYGTVPATSLWYSSVVRQAHLDFAASDAHSYCRDNDDLTFLADGLHFDAASCETFGEWAATTFTSLI